MKIIAKFLGLIIILFNICSIHAYEKRNLLEKEITQYELKKILLVNQEWNHYPPYSERESWNQLLGKQKKTWIKDGEENLNYDWKVVKATDYLEFERSGNRGIMEKTNNANITALLDLFYAEIAEGKGRFLDQIINGVYFQCENTSWALSAHLTRQKCGRSLPSSKEEMFDLASGDLSTSLSWIYYFLHDSFDKVNPEISKRLRHELQVRTLDAYMENDRYWWLAWNYKPGDMVNNWNPWCNFNALQCFMLLENDPELLSKAVWRSMVSVDKFLNYIKADGACEEGPTYWDHAYGKLYDYLQLLYNITDGKVSIFDNRIIKDAGEYIVNSSVGNDWSINFADAAAKHKVNPFLVYRYGQAVENKRIIKYASYLYKNEKTQSNKKDITRTLEDLDCRDALKKTNALWKIKPYAWYPQTEFCYIFNSKNNFFLATKGGYNNESHNHNDAGSFILYVDTIPMLVDAGVGTYTRQTFSSERYDIWTMQSKYHNLPIINGVEEKFGTNYRATEVSFSPKDRKFTANIATAFPEEAKVDSWIRSYQLNNKGLLIDDKFKLRETLESTILTFMTTGTIDIKTLGIINIKMDGKSINIRYNKSSFTPSIEKINLIDQRLSNVWGNKMYRIILTANKMILSGNYSLQVEKE